MFYEVAIYQQPDYILLEKPDDLFFPNSKLFLDHQRPKTNSGPECDVSASHHNCLLNKRRKLTTWQGIPS